MSKKLSFSIAINLLTDKFKSGLSSVTSMLGSLKGGLIGIAASIGAFAVNYFKKVYDEHKRIKNIFSEYKKQVANIGSIKEVKILQTQLAIMNDKTRSQKEINAAQAVLQKKLGKEKLSQEEINKRIADRIQLLKTSAEADLYARKAVEKEDVIRSRATDLGIEPEELKKIANLKRNNKSDDEYFKELNKVAGIEGNVLTRSQVKFRKKIIDAMDETIEDLKVIDDANKYLTDATNKANQLTGYKADGDSDDKAQRAAEKRQEAKRKLTAEDRKLQIEKQQFDIDMQQKSIDLLDDSFEKRTKQTILNLEKANLEINKKEDELLKKQEEYAKNQYVSKKGTDKGFEAYFDDLKKKGFKDENGISILPEGLRPEDIEKQVNQLLDAAKKAQEKGLKDINKDMSTMLREQEMMYTSDLKKKLSDTDAYYDDLLRKAKGNVLLIASIEANRTREKTGIKTDDKLKELDFKEQLEQEHLAGLESIGMTELVEEKKLEITKKYLQLRIEALQSLADAGDEDAQRQIKLYQAAIKTLNTQNPTKSLKGLADKAIFSIIKKGFESITKNSDDAEEKTTKLMGSISAKGKAVAETVGMLQSVFGGLNEDLDMAMETVGNIAQGFATGGIAGGAMAVIAEGMNLFSKASEAAARHQQALKEIAEARLESQRAYNLLLNEQNLLMKEAVSIFGEKQIARAANAIANYQQRLMDIKKEMQGSFTPDAAYEQSLQEKASSGGIVGFIYGKQLQDYQKQVENYNKGVAELGKQQIVTGHKKTGWFGWGKGKDTYSSILDVDRYKNLIKENGELDKAMLKTILGTEKMDDSTKKYLENILKLYEQAEAAQEELNNYLQTTFGTLGDDLMAALESAIKDKGINAWEEFGKAGAKVLENLGKQIAYELFFADKFKQLQEDLQKIYKSDKAGETEKEKSERIANEAADLVGSFYQNIGKDMEQAQGFMENWQKEAEKNGFELWKPDSSSTQDSSRGYSVSMDQDTGGAILGRITGIHESILTLTSMVGDMSTATSGSLTYTIGINDELKKHTEIFHEMRDIQTKTLTISKEMKESLDTLDDIKSDLVSINKNTKGLAPR